MKIKVCNKPTKDSLEFVQGGVYELDDEYYILAKVDETLYSLICLDDGNRYDDATSRDMLLGDMIKNGFKQVKPDFVNLTINYGA
jgi:hypothetical protein